MLRAVVVVEESPCYNHKDPITITPYGDVLVPYDKVGGSEGGTPEEIYTVAGTHEGCGGVVDFIPEIKGTPPYNVLHCRHCGLRVVVPQGVKTYKELYLDRYTTLVLDRLPSR